MADRSGLGFRFDGLPYRLSHSLPDRLSNRLFEMVLEVTPRQLSLGMSRIGFFRPFSTSGSATRSLIKVLAVRLIVGKVVSIPC